VALPERLAQIVEAFRTSPKDFRVEALLDFSKRLPPLPEELAANPESLEQVHECQTPFFLATRLEGMGAILARLKGQVAAAQAA
jgi:cysteine desulfuration protein SufE